MVKKASFSAEYKLFCKLLRDARATAGLSQEDVAKRLNRPQSYVSKYESGERRLDVIEFVRVATVLKVAPEDLVKKLAWSACPKNYSKAIIERWLKSPTLSMILKLSHALKASASKLVATVERER